MQWPRSCVRAWSAAITEVTYRSIATYPTLRYTPFFDWFAKERYEQGESKMTSKFCPLIDGDLLNSLFRKLRWHEECWRDVLRKSFAIAAITWCPMFVLAASQNVLVCAPRRQAFIFDFAAHVQFLVVVPLFFVFEYLIRDHLTLGLVQFEKAGLVHGADGERLQIAVSRARKACCNVWIDLLLAILSYGFAVILAFGDAAQSRDTWYAPLVRGNLRLSWCGYWAAFVAWPIFQYLLYRWGWKIVVWIWLLWKVSRLKIRLVGSHPDRAGGIGFIGDIQSEFGLLIFSIGAMVAATVGYKISVQGAADFYVYGPVLAFSVCAPFFFVAPLFFFTPKLFHTRHHALLIYAAFAQKTFALFEDKLESGLLKFDQPTTESELAEMYNASRSFDAVHYMRIVPFDLKSLGHLFFSAVSPMLPLFLHYLPAEWRHFEVVEHLLRAT